MAEMDGSLKSPQFSDMFHKFALSFKSKAFEFFSDDHRDAADDDPATFSLLDSPEEFIADEKVVVLKPDRSNSARNFQFNQTLIESIFASISSFEASYLQLQTAHVPFDEDAIQIADKGLVSHLQTLSEFKQLYKNYYRNPNFSIEFSTGSCLEFQVNENQTKLRALKSVFNRLQAEIDVKDDEVIGLKKKLEEIERLNFKLSNRLSCNLDENCEILLTVKVFDTMLRDTYRLVHKFTKVLIDLMKKASWDLDLAANSVYSGADYAKKGDSRYALLSYVCLRMFQGFDLEDFGLDESEISCNSHVMNPGTKKNGFLKQLMDQVSTNPIELLRKNPKCKFSRFCERKYQQLIHPTMESSIFNDFSQQEDVISSWKSLSVFYELFIKMVSSIWTLHNLAFSFDPLVDIFQVERDVDFSMVYMEDVTSRFKFPSKMRPKVGFTVVPGFKIGQTVIQSQVYLTGSKCTE